MPALRPTLTALALLAALILPMPCNAARVTMVSIDRPVVNMRDGAGTRHKAVWTLPLGYPLLVLARRDGWLQVRDFEGDTGWVLARLTARKPHLIVKVEIASLRSDASTRARRIGRLAYGDIVRTLGQRAGWAHVKRSDGATGWVARRLLWGW